MQYWPAVSTDVTIRYQMPATISSGIVLKFTAQMSWTAYRSSVTVITLAKDDVLSIEMVSLPVGGMITRIAWGRMIRRNVRPLLMPSACAASAWPCSTDSMQARTISAM